MPPPSERIAKKNYHYNEGYESSNGTVVRYQSGWTKQHQLEGDGLLPLLYDHMYKSDKTRETRLREIRIPDTVVFEHNFPRAWYNYDPKRKEIVKQPGKQLDANSIFKEFAVAENDCEIVAQFYYKDYTVPKAALASKKEEKKQEKEKRQRERAAQRSSMGGSSELMETTEDTTASGAGGGGSTANANSSSARGKRRQDDEDDEISSAVEFFTEETLYEFLHTRKVKPDGVLQKFVVPKGLANSRQNFCMQAVWSPKVTRVYKRTNRYRLNDRLTAVEQKAATFDGPPHYSTESLVASSTGDKITGVCDKIVKHVSQTEHKPIERLVLYLKEDNKGDLWVLWASSLRIGGDKYHKVTLRVPMQFALKVHTEKSTKPTRTVQGPDLNHRLLDSDIALYEMTGDWLFARSRCAGKGANSSNARTLHSSAGGGMTPRRPATGNSSTRQTPRTARKEGNSSEVVTPRTPATGKKDYNSSDEQGGALVVVEDEDAELSDGNTPRRGNSPTDEDQQRARFLSPRAPFLPQNHKPAPPLGPESPRHPLHEKYIAMKEEDDAIAQAKNQGHSGRKFTQRQQSSPDTAAQRRSKLKLHLTETERLKEQLRHTTNDLIYQAYSVTLQHGASSDHRGFSSRSDLPRHPDEVVLIPDLLKACLSPDQVQDLTKTIYLEEVPGSDGELWQAKSGALGRGRRQDRPVALLLNEVVHFYDREFEIEGKLILQRYKSYKNATTTEIDLQADDDEY